MNKNHDWYAIVFGICTIVIILPLIATGLVKGQEINLGVIKEIESGGNLKAVSLAGAIGLYQIMPITLKDYNQYHEKEYEKGALFDPAVNKKVAVWYIEKRIPEMLEYYGIEVTVENVLWAYNAGIGLIKDGIKPPETQNYIEKYFKLRRG